MNIEDIKDIQDWQEKYKNDWLTSINKKLSLFDKIKNIFINEEKIEFKTLKKKLIQEFLNEHEQYIPKYSPKGLKLNWKIYVYKDGEYDLYNGKFKGKYKVGIKQIPPRLLSKDDSVYKYNIENKEIECTGVWCFYC